MNIETTFEIDQKENPLLSPWLIQQYRITAAILKVMKPTYDNPHDPLHRTKSLFGEPKDLLQSAVGESVDIAPLSSYINHGMAGITRRTLFEKYRLSLRYRSSNPNAIVQYPMAEGGGLYVSGVPAGLVPLLDAKELQPQPITALVFTLDPAIKVWMVTVVQSYARPRKKPRKDKGATRVRGE